MGFKNTTGGPTLNESPLRNLKQTNTVPSDHLTIGSLGRNPWLFGLYRTLSNTRQDSLLTLYPWRHFRRSWCRLKALAETNPTVHMIILHRINHPELWPIRSNPCIWLTYNAVGSLSNRITWQESPISRSLLAAMVKQITTPEQNKIKKRFC